MPFGNTTAGIMILICACATVTLAAGLDALYVLHFESASNGILQKINSFFMLVGGILFLTASVLYLPSLERVFGLSCTTLGTWVFRVGSCCYLGGSFISLYLLEQQSESESENMKYQSLTSQDNDYCPTGTVPLLTPTKHIIGDSISEPTRKCYHQMSSKTAWLLVIYNFIFGAIAYIAGGIFSQFYDAFLAGGITWCIGSLLFVTGSFFQLFEVVRSWNK